MTPEEIGALCNAVLCALQAREAEVRPGAIGCLSLGQLEHRAGARVGDIAVAIARLYRVDMIYHGCSHRHGAVWMLTLKGRVRAEGVRLGARSGDER